MKIKICGMREAGNLAAVADLDPDLLGFIFSARSPRYVGEVLDPGQVRSLPAHIARVGVFVDEALAGIQAASVAYGLDYAQLHGQESPDFCRQVRGLGLRVIKAFAVGPDFDFARVAPYLPVCDLLLFDTAGSQPGGNGAAFDWELLRQYRGPLPFLLAGGLGPENLAALLGFQHPFLYGFDFNSRLETAPGHKDVGQVRELLERLREPA